MTMETDAMLEKFGVRECKVCTALIANDRRYGRKANQMDENVCECCETPDTSRQEQIMDNVIEITVRNLYGVDQFYPHNDQARGLAAIAGTKTLTKAVLRMAQDMGFTITVADTSIFA
jgi:hypothetical protein